MIKLIVTMPQTFVSESSPESDAGESILIINHNQLFSPYFCALKLVTLKIAIIYKIW